MLDVVRRATQGSLPALIDVLAVLRRDSTEERLVVERGPSGDAKHGVCLIGPEQVPARKIQIPTPDPRDLLGPPQVRLAFAY